MSKRTKLEIVTSSKISDIKISRIFKFYFAWNGNYIARNYFILINLTWNKFVRKNYPESSFGSPNVDEYERRVIGKSLREDNKRSVMLDDVRRYLYAPNSEREERKEEKELDCTLII